MEETSAAEAAAAEGVAAKDQDENVGGFGGDGGPTNNPNPTAAATTTSNARRLPGRLPDQPFARSRSGPVKRRRRIVAIALLFCFRVHSVLVRVSTPLEWKVVLLASDRIVANVMIEKEVDLTYLPWELDSIMSLNLTTVNASTGPQGKDIIGGHCVPPPSVGNKNCCLGSTSGGGQTSFKREAYCAVGHGAYELVRRAAARELRTTGPLRLISSATDVNSADDEGKGNAVVNKSRSPPPSTVCDICQIIDVCLRNNWTIGFTGDSVQRQVWDGFLCELNRNGYEHATVSQIQPPSGERWRYGVKMILTVSISWRGAGETAGGRNGQGMNAARGAETVTARFYAQYRPLEDMSEVVSLASETDVLIFNFGVHWLPEEEAAYEKMMRDVLSTFQKRNRSDGDGGSGNGRFALLAMRETSAQHFANPGGEYSKEVHYSGKQCTSMKEDDKVFGWRERIVDRVADQLGYRVIVSNAESLLSRLRWIRGGREEDMDEHTHRGLPAASSLLDGGDMNTISKEEKRLLRLQRRLQLLKGGKVNETTTNATDPLPLDPKDPGERDELLILPFLNFTRNLLDLHSIGNSADCTHFCSSPFIWTPLWRSLRLGLEYREEVQLLSE